MPSNRPVFLQKFPRHFLFSTALALFAVAAQAAAPGPIAQQPAESGAVVSTTPGQTNIQMVSAQAWLDKSIDAKKATKGTPITAKLQQPVSLSRSQELPRNSILEGHIDEVEPSENKGDSVVVVTFDKIKLKSGEEIAVKATVLAIALPLSMQQSAGGADSMQPGGAPPTPTGGGAMPRSMPSPPLSATQGQPGDPNSPAGQANSQHPNGVPGITLKSDIHDANSATFLSKGKNVHLSDGTQLQIALAVLPAGTTAH